MTARGEEMRRLVRRYIDEGHRYNQAHDRYVAQFPPRPEQLFVEREPGLWAFTPEGLAYAEATERVAIPEPSHERLDHLKRLILEAMGYTGIGGAWDEEVLEQASSLMEAIDVALISGDDLDYTINAAEEAGARTVEWLDCERAKP